MLTVSQTLIELCNSSPSQTNSECVNFHLILLGFCSCACSTRYRVMDVEEPFLNERHMMRPFSTRPRSKSKPDAIFIHPNDSNIARADAVASNLDPPNDIDHIHRNNYRRDEPAWTSSEGKGVARALLGASRKPSERDPFHAVHDSDSE